MGNGEVELPHLLRCKGCGVPNGRNAELCWSCGAGLGAGSRKRASPSTAPARSDAASSAGPDRSPGDGASERANAGSAARGPGRSLPATVVLALALAGLAAFWSPRSDRPSQAHAATSPAIEPLRAGAAPLLAAPIGRPNPAAESGVRERAVSAQQTAAAPINAQQAAWALGLAADASTPADSPAAGDGCRDVDRSLGLCSSSEPLAAGPR
jgi:hypothetical protein